MKKFTERMDRANAKKVGMSLEEWLEKKQTAKTMWLQLYNEDKVIDLYSQIPMHIGALIVDFLGWLMSFYLTLLVYNKVGNYGLPTKPLSILAIIFTVMWIVGMTIIFVHDKKAFDKYLEKIVTWVDTPCKVKKGLADSINGALGFTRDNYGCCYTNTPIPFCSIHSQRTDEGVKTYSLEFSGLPDWNYTKSVPLEKMEFNYIANTIMLEFRVYMQEYADYLIETEVLESEE